MTLEEFDKLCDRLEKRIGLQINRVVTDVVKEPLEDHENRVRKLEWKAAYLAGGIAATLAIASWAVYLVAK